METSINTGSMKLLFVDDEQNILSALRRLFRPDGYQVYTAESGAQGLEIIRSEAIDLVISDMRMPEMGGAEFLSQVRTISPDTIRVLLTGYADFKSTIQAINEGQIYRYINKPWEDSDMRTTVRHALERKLLEQDKKRLEALTQQQNEELKLLNASLEEKVKARTRELEEAHERLKKTFITSIRVFSNLLELREGAVGGHSRRVGDLCFKIAQQMGLSNKESQEVMLGGLLHDIGKIGYSDALLRKPTSLLTSEEMATLKQHPIVGQTALMAVDQLKDVGILVRAHHEQFDGKGYPEGLAGEKIPLGARIIAVANDFDYLQFGRALGKRLKLKEALHAIKEDAGVLYDPRVVEALVRICGASHHGFYAGIYKSQQEEDHEEDELPTPVAKLKPGMILARDIIGRDGLLLLDKDYVLDESLIDQLHNYEANNIRLTIYVSQRRIA